MRRAAGATEGSLAEPGLHLDLVLALALALFLAFAPLRAFFVLVPICASTAGTFALTAAAAPPLASAESAEESTDESDILPILDNLGNHQ